jgi:hypothetical protein
MLTKEDFEKVMFEGETRNSFLVKKLIESQKIAEDDLDRMGEILYDWRKLNPAWFLKILFENIQPISHKILSCHKGSSLRLIGFGYVVSEEQIRLFLEYSYHCLNNRMFSVSDIRYALKCIKKYVDFDSYEISDLAKGCIELCKNSLREVRKLKLIEFNEGTNRIFIYTNLSKSKLEKAKQKGAGVVGLDEVGNIDFDYDYCFRSISANEAQKLTSNGLHDSQFHIASFDKDGFKMFFEDRVQLYLFLTSLGDSDMICYMAGNFPIVDL